MGLLICMLYVPTNRPRPTRRRSPCRNIGAGGRASGPCLEPGPKLKPLPVLDQRQRHTHGPVAGVRVERLADKFP